jgi:hypothetical protein
MNREEVWDDLRVTADMVTLTDLQHTALPKQVLTGYNRQRGTSYSGICGLGFDHGRDGRGLFQNACFHCQLPHGYREGSSIEPHVHVRLAPGSDAEPGQMLLLELEYLWLNIGESPPESTEVIPLNHRVSREELSGKHLMISFGFLEKPEATISSMLSCRFSRVTIGEDWEQDFWRPRGLENDSFRGTMIFLEFDFHYRKDSLGSRENHRK